MTTAHRALTPGGDVAGVGEVATALGASYTIVRISWRTVPSASAADRMIALSPGRSVTGAATATDFCATLSACDHTSAPLSSTLALATPLLDVISAATTLPSSVTRARSSG